MVLSDAHSDIFKYHNEEVSQNNKFVGGILNHWLSTGLTTNSNY